MGLFSRLFSKNKELKRDLKSEAAVLSEKAPETLTKEEKKVIQARMREIKRNNRENPGSTQSAIPFLVMFKDGICQVSENYYTMTVQFFDTNYSTADFDEQNGIFAKYCSMLNTFDSSSQFQLTFENQQRSISDMLEAVKIPEKDDDFSELRKEYSDMLVDKLSSSSGQSTRKFLTFGVAADSKQQARSKLIGIKNDVIKAFKNFDVKARMLDGSERLETLYYSLNPFTDKEFIFDWKSMLKAGMDTKDFIAPRSLEWKKSSFTINNSCGQVWNLKLLAGEISDDILKDFLALPYLTCVNIHCQPIEQSEALKFVRRKLTNVNAMKVDHQKKASQSGYDMSILPPQIQMYIDDIEVLLNDLNSKDEKLFTISISIRCYAKNKKEMKLQADAIKRIVNKHNCTFFTYDFRQEQTLMSTLPIGYNDIPVERKMHTSGICGFVPFTTRELFSLEEGATYYGTNTLSGNMIRASRVNDLANPNGIVLGMPGFGKSFSVKREILDVFLITNDDIIICDPEGEYYPLVNVLDGQVVKISGSSKNYINPMEISFNTEQDENPITMKSDFIASMCEIIVGGKYGISAEERSVIDICVNEIYKPFMRDPSIEKMPTMTDLYEKLKEKGEIALRLVNSLEMFVNGSQNLFNHQTNIDLNNRVVCFDIKDLGSQLKKLGMLIIQETVWNRVRLNRERKKTTRYYIDEFHLLLRDEQTSAYSAEMWKRFRKWGGVPTGITQNVKDLLMSMQVESIFENSPFVYMLNQAPGDREILAENLHISDELITYVENVNQGEGLIKFGEMVLPFTDVFPTNTKMYQLLTTKPGESQ